MEKKKKKMAKEGITFSPAETAWNCFKGTGLLSYYLLYKKLNDKLDD